MSVVSPVRILGRERAGWRRWVTGGAVAIMDQGATGLAALAANLLLARWLAPEAYGAFVLGFSMLLIASTVHGALVLEPMSVLGPSRGDAELRAYLQMQVTKIHLLVVGPPAAVLILVGLVVGWLGSRPLGAGLLGGGMALPAVLWLWAVRRAAYVVGRPARALRGSMVALLVTVGLLVSLRAAGVLSVVSGFLAIGLGSLLGGAAAGRFGPADEGLSPGRALLEQWRYGAWMVAAAALTALGTQGPLLIAGLAGFEDAATVRAMQLPTLLASQAIFAVGALALPILAADVGRGDVEVMRRRVLILSTVTAVAAGVYALVLLVIHAPLERLLFDGRYASRAWLIALLASTPVLSAVTIGSSLAVRALQRPDLFLRASVGTAAAGLGAAVILTPLLGAAGAAMGIVAAYAASAIVTVRAYRSVRAVAGAGRAV